MEWYLAGWKKWADFAGRARRKEYWTFVLGNIAVMLILLVIDGAMGTFRSEAGLGVLSGVFSLLIIVPTISVGVRRLHDIGMSGWWVLLGLIPVVSLILLVFFLRDSQPGENQYGPNPKESEA